jgi:phosphoribosylformimino-5-aminoimidazole carboxamide ribotide isomerase
VRFSSNQQPATSNQQPGTCNQMTFQVIPSIDLRGGRVVRLQQGDYDRQLNYAVDPIETAKSFAAAGAQWMHIVDLDGAKEGRPVQYELIGAVARASGLHVEVGGGVRSTDDIRQLLAAGVTRVVVGTKAIEDWAWFDSIAHQPEFSQRLVLALDAKDGVVATRGWTAASGKLAADVAREVNGWPLSAILYTDVSCDGMLTGPNVEQTRRLAQAGSVPVIASGGVGNLGHIGALLGQGIWGVVVGRSLYEGSVDLRAALELAAGRT